MKSGNSSINAFLCRAGTIAVALSLITSFQVHASGIGLGVIRLIYKQRDGQVTVPVRNTSASPYLISSRVSLTPDGREQTPFFLSPPLFRLEGSSQGTVRVSGNTQQLPPDRESVFYMSVTGIPSGTPLSKTSNEGYLNGGLTFAYGSTIKLFYRPEGLPSSAKQAATSVQFHHSTGVVKIDNPSPYYVTFKGLKINGHQVKFSKKQPEMIAPFSSMTVPALPAFPISQAGKVSWSAIVDMGSIVSSEGVIE